MADSHDAQPRDRPEGQDPPDPNAPPTGGVTESTTEATLRIFHSIARTTQSMRDPRATEQLERIAREAEERLAKLREIHARARGAGGQVPAVPQGARPARILLADDHELAREALRSVLGREPDLVVAGEATGGRDAIAQTRRLSPDLVLMDIRMPDLDGLAATRAIVEASPETRVVLITTYESPAYILEGLRSGAAGYVPKGASKQELLATLRAVLSGAVSVHAPGAGHVLYGATGGAQPLPSNLSEREVAVLRLLARGDTNQAIGLKLHLTVNTVKTHVRHILRKLDAPDRAAAVARGAALGLLAPEEPPPPRSN